MEFVTNENLVTVSCPGKILVVGGYLVLERPNIGVTVATTARFFTTIKRINDDTVKPPSEGYILIFVSSPQFHQDYWFEYDPKTNDLHINASSPSNIFVEKCLKMTLSFVKEYLGHDQYLSFIESKVVSGNGIIGIKLRADNDFYSQISQLQHDKKPLVSSSLRELPAFNNCLKDVEGNAIVAKTGLGSSAALITSLVAALLQWFGVVHLPSTTDITAGKNDEDFSIVHNLAQLVHANAQGKIGSGFDVSSAVYGTHIYTRFAQKPFESCLEEVVPADLLHDKVVNSKELWNQDILPFALPSQMGVLLGDICGGSNSPSMAKAVIAWKTKDINGEASRIWNELAEHNTLFYQELAKLNSFASDNTEAYNEAVAILSEVRIDEYEAPDAVSFKNIVISFKRVRELLGKVRGYLKIIGEQAGVEIEPNEQSILLDATINLPGVLAGGVPGAGGRDAVFVLTLSSAARDRVELLWSKWDWKDINNYEHVESTICPLLLTAAGKDAGVLVDASVLW